MTTALMMNRIWTTPLPGEIGVKPEKIRKVAKAQPSARITASRPKRDMMRASPRTICAVGEGSLFVIARRSIRAGRYSRCINTTVLPNCDKIAGEAWRKVGFPQRRACSVSAAVS